MHESSDADESRLIVSAFFTHHTVIKSISRIKLDRWLVGENFYHTTRFRIFQTGSQSHRATLFKESCMVVAAAKVERLEVGVDLVPRRGQRPTRCGDIFSRNEAVISW
jgi:hypothetical protein